MNYKTKDTGKRRKFKSQAVRDANKDKGRYDLISPIVMQRLAKLSQRGAIKYKDGRNWEKGINLSVFLDSAMRHLYQFVEGQIDEDHLTAIIWNIQGIIHTKEMIKRGKLPKELNDLPNYL